MITKTDLSGFRAALEAKLIDLKQHNETTGADRATVELDQQSGGRLSRMDAMQQQAMAKATHLRRNTEIARTCAALLRIEEGEFGYCTDCGEDIQAARLRHDPSLLLCLNCARST